MTKAVSNENLARFKAKCDETYAKVGESTGANVVENPILSLFTKATTTLNITMLGQEVYVEYYYFKENQNPVNIPITATLSFSGLETQVPVTNVLELYAILNILGGTLVQAEELPSIKVSGISGIQNTLVQNTTIVTSAFNVVSGNPDFETPAFVANSFIMKKFPDSTFIEFQLDLGERLIEIDLNSIEDTYLTVSIIQMVRGSRVLPAPSPSTAGQVPVVNAAGNGYELQAQSSGGITQSTVIERPESLPTATADSPDFVQTPDGTLYRKKAVDGGVAGVLTETTIKGVFKIEDRPYIIDVRFEENLNFSSNNTNFSSISADSTRGTTLTLKYGSTTVYNGTWTNTAYQTVNFGDVEQSFDGISWFYDYFRQVATPVTPSVSYEYVAQQDIPTPTTADNGKVLGVANGAYALQAAGGGGTKLYKHHFNISSALGESGQLIAGADKCILGYIDVISITQDKYATFNDFYDDILYEKIIRMENSLVNATIQWYVQDGDREHDNDWISTYSYLYVFYRTGITTYRLNPTAGPNAISSDTVTPL